MPPESLGSTRWTPHLLFSPLQYLRWLQGTSPLSLCYGDTAKEKAAACSQGTQEVALKRFLGSGDYSTSHPYSHQSIP